MPGNLRDKEAREEWKRITELLDGVGIITRVDVKCLLLWCNTWSQYRESDKALVKNGVIMLTNNGSPIQSPHVNIVNNCRATMLKLLAEMGLTPSSRTKVHALPVEMKDKASLFLDDVS